MLAFCRSPTLWRAWLQSQSLALRSASGLRRGTIRPPAKPDKMKATRASIAGAAGRKAVASAIDLLFPPRCVACGNPCEPTGDKPLFCASCNGELAICGRPTCSRCATVCSEADLPHGNCGNCRGAKLLFDSARTIGPYEGALRQAVLMAKHALYEPLSIALGERLAEAIERQPLAERPDLVVPVPVHWLKRIWRKTNPAS